MQLKKLLALLLSAALALSLLAGCGGESVASALLKLLDGRYPNISIEIDPELEADLRQAIRKAEAENAGDAAAAIRAALETALGSTITFRYLGDGQKGDTAFDLVFYAGSDPDKAAQAAYSQWNLVFANVPADGQYDTALAMVETNSGIWMLVKATVEKAGSRDDDDDDDEPEKPYSVTMADNKVTKVTVDADAGFQDVLFGEGSSDSEDEEEKALAAAREKGFEDVTIELAAGETYTVSEPFTGNNGVFLGTLQGKGRESTTITLNEGSNGLFAQIGVDGGPDENNGTVENITFEVQTNITNTYAGGGNHFAGAVAGMNFGNITDCMVTINGSISATDGNCFAGAVAGLNNGTITNCKVKLNGHTINARGNRGQAAAGGLVGCNYDTITDCTVTIEGSISATSDSTANAGGIAGGNESEGKIEGNSQVTIESGTITATGKSGASAGGLVGQNRGSVAGTYSGGGSIQATGTSVSASASAGGLAGENSGAVEGTYSGTGRITANAKKTDNEYYTASVPNDDDKNPNIDTQGNARAGTQIGLDEEAKGPVPYL